jgi:hypothetical protein
LRPKLSGSSQIGVAMGGGQWFITLAPDCPSFAAVSDCLNHGGAIPLQFPDGGVASVPVKHRYQFAPPEALHLLFINLPPPFNVEEFTTAVLEMAGYTVLLPPSNVSFPGTPPPNSVFLLNYRNGLCTGGYTNPAIIRATVVPPADDPFLHHLPPSFRVEGWVPDILTLVEHDRLPKVPRGTGHPAGRTLPSDLGPGFANMDVDRQRAEGSRADGPPLGGPAPPPQAAAAAFQGLSMGGTASPPQAAAAAYQGRSGAGAAPLLQAEAAAYQGRSGAGKAPPLQAEAAAYQGRSGAGAAPPLQAEAAAYQGRLGAGTASPPQAAAAAYQGRSGAGAAPPLQAAAAAYQGR